VWLSGLCPSRFSVSTDCSSGQSSLFFCSPLHSPPPSSEPPGSFENIRCPPALSSLFSLNLPVQPLWAIVRSEFLGPLFSPPLPSLCISLRASWSMGGYPLGQRLLFLLSNSGSPSSRPIFLSRPVPFRVSACDRDFKVNLLFSYLGGKKGFISRSLFPSIFVFSLFVPVSSADSLRVSGPQAVSFSAADVYSLL